ncbi:MAG TPA: laccase domain-containing protein [Candidatus Wirthbacteria bacterium]|nr:laccase domain-containing protein [Candidatus Wirthbacteria bacterium]
MTKYCFSEVPIINQKLSEVILQSYDVQNSILPNHWILPSGFRLGFSDQSDGDMKIVDNCRKYCADLGVDYDKLVMPRQVHSNHVLALGNDADCLKPGQADGLFSDQKHVLGILVADCLPVYLFHLPSGRIALVHAGWQGIRLQIINSALEQFD